MSEKFFITLSPAKKFSRDPMPTSLHAYASTPVFLEEADRLVSELRQLKASDLCRIMKISQDLGELNYNRYQQYQGNYHSPTHLAALSFAGDAFQSLSAHTLSTDTLIQSQTCVGILSGLYGILKPLDAIQPYRLEMGCKPFPNKTLYSIWQKDLTGHLKNTLADGKFTCHLNCASQEYGSVVDTKQLGIPTCSLKFSVRSSISSISKSLSIKMFKFKSSLAIEISNFFIFSLREMGSINKSEGETNFCISENSSSFSLSIY